MFHATCRRIKVLLVLLIPFPRSSVAFTSLQLKDAILMDRLNWIFPDISFRENICHRLKSIAVMILNIFQITSPQFTYDHGKLNGGSSNQEIYKIIIGVVMKFLLYINMCMYFFYHSVHLPLCHLECSQKVWEVFSRQFLRLRFFIRYKENNRWNLYKVGQRYLTVINTLRSVLLPCLSRPKPNQKHLWNFWMELSTMSPRHDKPMKV